MSEVVPSVRVSIQNHEGSVVFRNLILNQTVCGHHRFNFIWNIGDLKHDTHFQLDVIKNNIGSGVAIEINDNLFSGIITQISVQDTASTTQSFFVQGESLTILMDDIPHAKSYYKKTLENIIKGTLESIPDNVIKKDISPVNKDELHYLVQYNETDFQFLQRLSQRYGEWFYYDGTKIIFGQVEDSGAKLKSGSNLTSFVIQSNLQPNKFSYKSYDYHKGEPIIKELSSFSGSVKNDFSTAVASKSSEIYSRADDRPMHNFNLANKKMMDALMQLETDRIDAQIITVRGESKHHALRPGYKFVVQTPNGDYDYVATSVVHISNVAGHYENSFTAVPASVKVPPYTNPHIFRKAETQTAMTKENHDSDGLGRIKVQFHWQSGGDMTPWLRVSSPHGGGGKGMHFIPEKGEEAIVDFEGGDVDKPFVAGTVYSGAAKITYSNADNDLKVIQTRSGHVIELNDKDGAETITIKDKNNNTIEINTADDSINLTANSSINMTASTINMMASGAIMMNAGAAIEGAAGTMVTFGAGLSTSLTSGKDTIILAGKMLSASGGKSAKFASGSGATLDLDAKGEAKFNSTKKMDISSKESTITGSDKATLKSNQTFVEGSSKAVVKGSQVDIS